MSDPSRRTDKPAWTGMPADVEVAKILQLPGAADGASDESGFSLDPDLLRENLITGFGPAGSDTHPYFVMRSQLIKHAAATNERVFAITSAQPGNGKTHVAVNLAAALSRIRPTILIELDLRRPSICARLGLPTSHPGIDDYLSGAHEFAASAIRIAGFDLVVHAVRQPHAEAEKLLASTRLREMSDALRRREDQSICIIDTPPAVVHDDMMLIAPVSDGVLMVVQEASTTKRALLDTIKSLHPTPVLGSILNMSISSSQPSRDYDSYYGRPREY